MCIHIAKQSEIIQMSVFIGDEIVQHKHPVKCCRHIGNTLFLADIYKMQVGVFMVCLRFKLRHTPRTDKFGFRCHEVLAHAVRFSALPEHSVWHMGNIQSFHNLCGDQFIERLLR